MGQSESTHPGGHLDLGAKAPSREAASACLSPSRHGPNTHVASDAMLKIIATREIVFAKGGSQKIPPAVSRVVW
jgi:hypothetical protein